ncbi:Crp/Fnr family transcriptional regulator [Aureispira anguillae]|uniref:Crp/Fnr family transcriptional regulator n=1 Tax=Aureispira anguillae TaxID=2864201 RepID=A0A915YCB0_9BACT|nr:Crp/Fnr family transcriptional regulator [Aureispira anguillae]BDS10454.1 Crp/Fnr family transcriptional regulator [Aureispira anguillae]
MNKIEAFFDRFPFLKSEDIALIHQIAVKKTYQVGDEFIKLGATRKKIGIIQEGLIRGYYIKSSGEEVSILFAKEGEVASTHELIFYNTPSRQIVEFLEPTTMLVLDYRDIEQLALTHPGIEQLKNQFIQDYLVKVLQRLETFLVYTPKERYQWLMKEEPSFMQRVQQKHLASFLGITPVSLSRLRSRMNKK